MSSDTSHFGSTTTVALSLTDLHGVQQAIEVAARRGAFAVEEFSEVGRLYDKLKAFLASQGGQQQQLQKSSELAAPSPPFVPSADNDGPPPA